MSVAKMGAFERAALLALHRIIHDARTEICLDDLWGPASYTRYEPPAARERLRRSLRRAVRRLQKGAGRHIGPNTLSERGGEAAEDIAETVTAVDLAALPFADASEFVAQLIQLEKETQA